MSSLSALLASSLLLATQTPFLPADKSLHVTCLDEQSALPHGPCVLDKFQCLPHLLQDGVLDLNECLSLLLGSVGAQCRLNLQHYEVQLIAKPADTERTA